MVEATRGRKTDEALRKLIRQCQAAPLASDERRSIFDQIFMLTHRQIWCVLKPGLDDDACQDLRQEVFLKIYRNIDRFDERVGVQPMTWMGAVARNAKKDRLRASRAAYRRSVIAFEGDDHADRHAAPAAPSAEALQGAFATLSPREELVLDVYYGGDGSRADAARQLGWSERKLKKTVEGLRKKLMRQTGVADFIAGARGTARQKPGR